MLYIAYGPRRPCRISNLAPVFDFVQPLDSNWTRYGQLCGAKLGKRYPSLMVAVVHSRVL